MYVYCWNLYRDTGQKQTSRQSEERIEQRERKHSIPDNITDTGYYQLSNFLFSLCVSIFYLRRRLGRPVHIERFLWGTQCPLD